jgi:type I restriction enzyme S subunit
MNVNWPKVPLGKILRRANRFERKEPLTEYHFAGTYSFARGIFVGQRKLGSTFRLDKVQRIQAGDFIYCKIMAWEGAFGVAPTETDNCVMSGAFVAYEIDRTLAEPGFLDWYFKIPSVWRLVGSGSTGTNVRRRSLDPEDFELTTIPLPSIDEQRRIVARIEQLAAKLEESRVFRHDALTAVQKLVTAEAEACFRTLLANNGIRKFSDFRPHVTSGPRNWGAYYSNSGTRFYRAQDVGSDFQISDGSKVYVSTPANGQAEGAKLQPGDLMLVITGATVGRCTVFPSGGEPGLVNQHVALCRFPKESIIPEYLLWGLRSERGQEQLLGQRYGQGKPGLNLDNIRALELPFPSMADQRRTVAHLDSFLAKVNSIKKLQSETAAELDALMPSILSKAFRGEL